MTYYEAAHPNPFKKCLIHRFTDAMCKISYENLGMYAIILHYGPIARDELLSVCGEGDHKSTEKVLNYLTKNGYAKEIKK